MTLSRSHPKPKIILIEPRDRFIFSPLLYELLSEEIKPWEIAPSYSSLLSATGIVWIQENVESINNLKKYVITNTGLKINYSQIVLSLGSKPNNLCLKGLSEHALMFQDLSDVKKRDISKQKRWRGVQKKLFFFWSFSFL